MKQFFLFFIGLMSSFSGGIYDLNLVSLDGTSLALSQFQGRKLMIVVLPVTRLRKDSVQLQLLDSVSRQYSAQLTVLGVPSYENGFTPGAQASLHQFYSSLMGPQVLLIQGMYTNKSSGSQQHHLFAWLTDKGKNGHFDEDIKGTGQKFLINERGQLMSVLGPDIGLTKRVMGHLIPLQ